jgi:hypothetical protein
MQEVFSRQHSAFSRQHSASGAKYPLVADDCF